MPRKSIEPRKPKTEDVDWYATAEGRRETQREFTRALREGKIVRSRSAKIAKTDAKTIEQLMQQAKENATRAISLRIPIADLERAKQIAAKTGVGYQLVLKDAIRHGLRKAG